VFRVDPDTGEAAVVASGFLGATGLAIADDGSIYVAELFGGALTVIRPGAEPATLVSGPIGGGVDATGRGNVVYTQSGPPEFGGAPVATLNSLRGGKSADLGAYEAANNPDSVNTYGLVGAATACEDAAGAVGDRLGPPVFTGQIESNPYAVAIDWDGSRIVADAAGNDLVRVSPSGKRLSTVAVLPPVVQPLTEEAVAGLIAQVNGSLPPGADPIPNGALDACIGEEFAGNPVPTDVEVGPNGHYYVSSLPGFPEADGGVFRVNRWSGAVTRIASGLHGAVDLAVAADGTIYVAELFGNSIAVIKGGAVVDRIPLDSPGAVEIRGHTLYATSGVFGPSGSVVMRSL
jgi:hypothetical protein